MKVRIAFLFLLSNILCQSYKITILGYHATDVTQIIHTPGEIEYIVQNRGLLDLIWPTNNLYSAKYDSNNFNLISWSKKIQQGSYKRTLLGKNITNTSISYDDENIVTITNPIHTILTMLAMIQKFSPENLDTKWFNFEHEGRLGKARFIWADSSMAWGGVDSILCDHYRLDISITDSSQNIGEIKDYFMKYIINDNFVRELWVSRSKKKQIILAKLQTPWVSLFAQRNSDKEN